MALHWFRKNITN